MHYKKSKPLQCLSFKNLPALCCYSRILLSNAIDVLVVSETWLDFDDPSSAYHIEGYNLFQNGRQAVRGGGAALYANSSLNVSPICCFVNTGMNNVCVRVKSNKQNIIIAGCYVAPDEMRQNYSEKWDDLARFLLKPEFSSTKIVLMGDFNCDMRKKLCNG